MLRWTLGILLSAIYLTAPAEAARRAFVFGISDYLSGDISSLKNPANDADELRKLLKDKFHFDVTYLPQEKTNLADVNRAWTVFVNSLRRNDEVLIYYSGHGISVNGMNFFIPRDLPSADIAADQPIDKSLIPLAQWFNRVALTLPRVAIWILDACRDNKVNVTGKQKGLAYYPFGVNSLAMFAAAEGMTALDRLDSDTAAEKHSLFSRVLFEQLSKHPGQDVGVMALGINKEVANRALPKQQNPVTFAGLSRDWCFGTCDARVDEVSFENSARKRVAANTIELAATKSVIRQGLARNAIFLGRKSAVIDCREAQGSLHPFGCGTLSQLAAGDTKKVIAEPLTATSWAYRRKRAPTVTEGRAVFDSQNCKLGYVGPGERVEITGVLEIKYAAVATGQQDVFYWGLLPENKPCVSTKVERNLVAKLNRNTAAMAVR